MSILREIENYLESKKTENLRAPEEVLKWILTSPEKFAVGNLKSLSELLYTSHASIIRACKLIGYDFSELRFRIWIYLQNEKKYIERIEILEKENRCLKEILKIGG